MAGSTAYSLNPSLHYWVPRPDLVFPSLPSSLSHYTMADIFCGTPTTLNLPAPTNTPSGISSCLMHSFFFDYYLQIHMSPNPVDFGVIASTRIKSVDIYNTFLTDVEITAKNVSGISEALDGLGIGGLDALPLTIPSLTVATITVTANVTGTNPEFDGDYVLTFDELDTDGTTVLTTFNELLGVAGQRSTLYAFSPFNKMKYSLAFKTRISESMTGEQRASLLTRPYENIAYKYRLKTERAYHTVMSERIEAALPITIPLWMYYEKLSTIVSGVFQLTLDTEASTYIAGGSVLIWESEIKSEVIEIEEVTDTSIILSQSVAYNFTDAFVMPVRIGNVVKGKKIKQSINDEIKVEVDFTLTDQQPLITFGPSPLAASVTWYKSRPILLDPNFQKSSSESFEADFEEVSGDGYGKRYYPINEMVRYKRNYVWKAFDRTEFRRIVLFFNMVQGKKKPFYVPSFRADFEVAVDIDTNDTFIRVVDYGVDLSKIMVNQNFCIFKRDGTIYTNMILSVTRDSFGVKFNLNDVIGQDIALLDIVRVSMLDLVRLSSDRIEINFDGVENATCKFPCVSVTDKDGAM